jgi:CDP-diacylglycerol---serine O-phosphatidyltransferase
LITVVFLLTIPISVMRYRKLDRHDAMSDAEDKPSPSGIEPPPVV